MLIFIAGVHGVGKGYLCEKYTSKNNVIHKSASQLIREHGSITLPTDKLVTDADRNQLILASALNALAKEQKTILLDGHFCLALKGGGIKKLDLNVINSLNVDAVVLIENTSDIIKKRIFERDGKYPSYDLENLKELEQENAFYICDELNIQIKKLTAPTLKEFTSVINNFERDFLISAQKN
ncbi:ATP-binding protein [Erwinia sp. HDF1-3R]|uniref:ATP-binding protein n=1 Tax=Erwinia sp. HDF1-3R TaxID=3141543 RepID=UPI0031F5595C